MCLQETLKKDKEGEKQTSSKCSFVLRLTDAACALNAMNGASLRPYWHTHWFLRCVNELAVIFYLCAFSVMGHMISKRALASLYHANLFHFSCTKSVHCSYKRWLHTGELSVSVLLAVKPLHALWHMSPFSWRQIQRFLVWFRDRWHDERAYKPQRPSVRPVKLNIKKLHSRM